MDSEASPPQSTFTSAAKKNVVTWKPPQKNQVIYIDDSDSDDDTDIEDDITLKPEVTSVKRPDFSCFVDDSTTTSMSTKSSFENENIDTIITVNDVNFVDDAICVPNQNVPQPVLNPSVDVRMISGVKVEFPVKPYPPQIAIMDKVIKGITKRENCLLESPTGSGKTLALLCSSLAWQRQEKQRVEKVRQEIAEKLTRKEVKWKHPQKNDNVKNLNDFEQWKYSKPKPMTTINLDDEDDDVFKNAPPTTSNSKDTSDDPLVNIHKRQRMSSSANQPDSEQPIEEKMDIDFIKNEMLATRVPKIYFGTRTHKQIAQVIRELKKTTYARKLKMSILSSREHTCIRDLNKEYSSKTEMCRDLLDKRKRKNDKKDSERSQDFQSGCEFKDKIRRLFCSNVHDEVWDIEELVKAGKVLKACPYFTARELTLSADIIFCPYNYLMDPMIKSSTGINCDDDIIVIDEAHNIEDTCRDAASLTVEERSFKEVIENVENLIKIHSPNVDHYLGELYFFKNILKNWIDWFENHTPLLQKQPNNMDSSYAMSGIEFAESMARHSFDINVASEFYLKVTNLMQRLKDSENHSKGLTLSNFSLQFLESLCIIFSFFYRNNSKNVDDYKAVLVKKTESNFSNWITKKSKTQEEKLLLNIVCMNSAIVFEPVEKVARCIILSSGTLTPTMSFPAELGTKFPISLQANHVITAEQIWVGSITNGPNGYSTEAIYKNTLDTRWQDSLGQILIWICKNVPNGVLCFLPSYRLMDTLCDRWQSTGLWNQMESIKAIFTESKRMKEHDEIMTDYYNCVGDDSGAILFAVYRGKVSEGMDFRDHQARAVVSIGIPYPNVKDPLIESKMKYNDSHKIDRQLLSSREWLQVQAYRALNQALGRCIRHKNDWGAIILVDSRFQNEHYTKHVSKWVRNYLGNNHYNWNDFTMGRNSLNKFMERKNREQSDVA